MWLSGTWRSSLLSAQQRDRVDGDEIKALGWDGDLRLWHECPGPMVGGSPHTHPQGSPRISALKTGTSPPPPRLALLVAGYRGQSQYRQRTLGTVVGQRRTRRTAITVE